MLAMSFVKTGRNVLSMCRNVKFNIQTGMKYGISNALQNRYIPSLSYSSFSDCLWREGKNSSITQNTLLTVPSSTNLNQVRYLKQPRHPNKKITYPYNKYKFSGWKRIHKFGLEARLSSVSQKEILWRRLIKGRSNLTVCDRLLDHSNRTVPNRQKVHLMKVGKKNNFPLYSYKPPVFKFRD
ncbi:uncharacterized protein LOC125650245 [Ostrea edulis]|uniref:uncharacterized protein LOC125650245 n=1 Tax=Ostrea edulis TaxID=37623 RepID=UPI0024AFC778|nr:uncharacterized protein LOC125650245 [Ostrea edulis]